MFQVVSDREVLAAGLESGMILRGTAQGGPVPPGRVLIVMTTTTAEVTSGELDRLALLRLSDDEDEEWDDDEDDDDWGDEEDDDEDDE